MRFQAAWAVANIARISIVGSRRRMPKRLTNSGRQLTGHDELDDPALQEDLAAMRHERHKHSELARFRFDVYANIAALLMGVSCSKGCYKWAGRGYEKYSTLAAGGVYNEDDEHTDDGGGELHPSTAAAASIEMGPMRPRALSPTPRSEELPKCVSQCVMSGPSRKQAMVEMKAEAANRKRTSMAEVDGHDGKTRVLQRKRSMSVTGTSLPGAASVETATTAGSDTAGSDRSLDKSSSRTRAAGKVRTSVSAALGGRRVSNMFNKKRSSGFNFSSSTTSPEVVEAQRQQQVKDEIADAEAASRGLFAGAWAICNAGGLQTIHRMAQRDPDVHVQLEAMAALVRLRSCGARV